MYNCLVTLVLLSSVLILTSHKVMGIKMCGQCYDDSKHLYIGLWQCGHARSRVPAQRWLCVYWSGGA